MIILDKNTKKGVDFGSGAGMMISDIEFLLFIFRGLIMFTFQVCSLLLALLRISNVRFVRG
ncbi:hypothetical protein [Spirabiliibacterium falconis]|uniref:hypothetical protein n=1 Tax=Spirabiliibacterium falconis TaxID=572023 RepID=UPI001AAC52C7|nr:hypothetical protein [Spirabiliibacterium falconis]MBE2893521.1 hypothetical protein [Spirabiliibacterium falconis]